MRFNTTRAISPQILRHRSFSFQEFSQRYAVATEFEMPHLRRQDVVNRQNSIDDLPQAVDENFGSDIANHFTVKRKICINECLMQVLLKNVHDAVLPLNTTTRLYMSGTIRSWLHYIDLRSWHGTQWEHTQIALNALAILKEQLPTIADAMWPNESLTETT